MTHRTSELLRSAREAETKNRPELAFRCYAEVLDSEPDNVEALVGLGGLAAAHGQRVEAEALLQKALRIMPNQPIALRWLTSLLVGQGNGMEAVGMGRKAIAATPSDAQAHAALGLACLGAGLDEDAILAFRKAVEIEPQMAGAYHNLGVAYQRDEQFENAIRSYRDAIRINPGMGASYLHMARSLLSNHQLGEAIEAAEQSAKLLPNSAAVQRVLNAARIQSVLGDGAMEPLESAIADEPNSAFLLALKGSRLQDLGKFPEAERVLLQSIQLQPLQGFAYYVLVNNRKQSKEDLARFEFAINHFEDTGLSKAESQYLHYALGKLFDDLGNYEKAMSHLVCANEPDSSSIDQEQELLAERFVQRTDRLIQLIDSSMIDMAKDLGSLSERPVFIFGMPRSGTTLIEQILSRHPRIEAGGELSFWRDRGRRILSLQTGEFDPNRLKEIALRYDHYLSQIGGDKPRVTDKFPTNYMFLGLLWLAFPRAKFIHARRHPIDTALSIYMRPFVASEFGGNSKARIVANYQSYQRSMRHWDRLFPEGTIHNVQYERLVTDREAETRRLIEYLNLEWDERCLSPDKGDRTVVTFSKWQVRQPVYQSSVARWKRYEPWLGAFRELQADGE